MWGGGTELWTWVLCGWTMSKGRCIVIVSRCIRQTVNHWRRPNLCQNKSPSEETVITHCSCPHFLLPSYLAHLLNHPLVVIYTLQPNLLRLVSSVDHHIDGISCVGGLHCTAPMRAPSNKYNYNPKQAPKKLVWFREKSWALGMDMKWIEILLDRPLAITLITTTAHWWRWGGSEHTKAEHLLESHSVHDIVQQMNCQASLTGGGWYKLAICTIPAGEYTLLSTVCCLVVCNLNFSALARVLSMPLFIK